MTIRTILTSLCFLLCFTSLAQQEFEYTEGDTTYVMRQYFFCLLKKGPNHGTLDSTKTATIQAGHMAHINAMAEADQVALAGPFGDDGHLRGILVFTVATLEEAKALTAEDPAVQAGVLEMEIHPWWAARGSKLP